MFSFTDVQLKGGKIIQQVPNCRTGAVNVINIPPPTTSSSPPSFSISSSYSSSSSSYFLGASSSSARYASIASNRLRLLAPNTRDSLAYRSSLSRSQPTSSSLPSSLLKEPVISEEQSAKLPSSSASSSDHVSGEPLFDSFAARNGTKKPFFPIPAANPSFPRTLVPSPFIKVPPFPHPVQVEQIRSLSNSESDDYFSSSSSPCFSSSFRRSLRNGAQCIPINSATTISTSFLSSSADQDQSDHPIAQLLYNLKQREISLPYTLRRTRDHPHRFAGSDSLSESTSSFDSDSDSSFSS